MGLLFNFVPYLLLISFTIGFLVHISFGFKALMSEITYFSKWNLFPVLGFYENMDSQKCMVSTDTSLANASTLSFANQLDKMARPCKDKGAANRAVDTDVEIDLREVYFLIMHFLSAGPCKRTFEHFWNELVEHQLLPRRYHAWFSRSGLHSGNDDDDGISFPLNYNVLVDRYLFHL